jgi:hypothetical protein
MDNKLRSITLRVEPEVWDRVVRLAREARRPPAQLARLMLEDAVAARPADAVGAAHAAA